MGLAGSLQPELLGGLGRCGFWCRPLRHPLDSLLGGRGSASRAEEAETLGASAGHLPCPKCPGLGVLPGPLGHPKNTCAGTLSVCLDSGVSSSAERTFALTGVAGGLLISESDLSPHPC